MTVEFFLKYQPDMYGPDDDQMFFESEDDQDVTFSCNRYMIPDEFGVEAEGIKITVESGYVPGPADLGIV